jgi:alpha-1,3-mannosyltransferase
MYALALGVKMNALLYLPGILFVFVLATGVERAIRTMTIVVEIQVLLAVPFTKYARNYLAKAFDLGRQFLYKWTVNWRFIDETTFLSKEFAITLLLGHLFTLFIFATTRWIKYLFPILI